MYYISKIGIKVVRRCVYVLTNDILDKIDYCENL